MASQSATNRPEGSATAFDWALFLILVIVGGSSFAMIRGALDSVPPAVVTVARLWVGAIFLYAIMKQAGRKFPPLFISESNRTALQEEWRWMLAVSVIGYIFPFFVFPWAQQFVESGLAGVYMAFMPIWTVVLAYFFAGETLGSRKIVGIGLGFAGVMILLGPEVIDGIGRSGVLAQVMILLATVCYAAAAVIARRAPPIRPRVFATGTLLCAAVLSTPALFLTDLKTDQWTLAGVANVILLGLGPTGLAGILLIILIQRVGAGFMGLANYVTPVWAVIMGAVLFQERLEATVFLALAVILAGVAISQRRARKDATLAPDVSAQTKI